jgi:diaminopimelate epimerase
VAAYLCSKQNKNELAIRTGAGVKTCKLTSRNGMQYVFQIAMGQPQIGSELSIPISSGSMSGIQVSLGNPHFVCIVKEFPLNWQLTAAELARDACFKHGINIEFVVIKDRSNIEVRFFERGVGQTQSSGTGSCAAAVAAITAGEAQSPVLVHAEGGIQTVDWNNEVSLEGAATLLCRGEFFA